MREMPPLDEIDNGDGWQRFCSSWALQDRVRQKHTGSHSAGRFRLVLNQGGDCQGRIVMLHAFLCLFSAVIVQSVCFWYLDDDWQLPTDLQRPVG